MQQHLKQVEDEIAEHLRTKYSPPMPLDLNEAPAEVRRFAQKYLRDADTPLQLIAAAITGLTWRDAETMGAGIQAKIKPDGTLTGLTTAIQEWAETYCHAGTDAQ
jgi:hypothetical protein